MRREVVTLAKLTDKQKKQIISDYVETQNYSEAARRNDTTATTVKRIVDADNSTLKKVEQKKEQNAIDIIAHMDSRKDRAVLFIDRCMDELLKPGRLEKARITDITTAMGTVYDKFTALPNSRGDRKSSNIIEAIKQEAREIFDEDEGEGPDLDDGI